MLDKFLKFLQSSSPERDFEGSYLDHLLEAVYPRVKEELEDCPEHDPLLVVIAEVLRETLPDEWDDELIQPLFDEQSPPLAAPEPPPLDPDASEADDEVGAEEDVEILETSEIELSEEEVERLTNEAPGSEGRPRLDSPQVLQAGRMFLGMLLENDRLPLDMQLTVAETMLARDLLLGYFVEDDHFEDKAQELLALVEQKFNEGAFGQAHILLQLFQTDPQTRVTNDRSLFHQGMFLKLGVSAQSLFGDSSVEELPGVDEFDDLDDALEATGRAYASKLQKRLHLFSRDPERAERWRALANTSRREGAAEVVLRYLPPKRWRPIHDGERPPSQVLRDHISAGTAVEYMLRQLEACYFILRAGGDTELEPFLDDFFDWMEETFSVDVVRMMPLLHRQTMSQTDLIADIFEQMVEEFLYDELEAHLDKIDQAAIDDAATQALARLREVDLDELPDGHYDFGGLVYDELFEMEYFSEEFGLKLHRIM